MADETLQHDTTLATPDAVPAPPRVTESHYPETRYPEAQFTDREVAELRRRLDDESGERGGNRFGWFLTGFLAALLSIAVAALVFLAVSDQDDDGNIIVDVPAVDVQG